MGRITGTLASFAATRAKDRVTELSTRAVARGGESRKKGRHKRPAEYTSDLEECLMARI
jgi:hypothetical protein